MAAGDIIDSLEAIVANDDWTWASHVTVVNSTTRQIEGYLSITFRRPLVASAALGDEASQPSNNSSVSADGWRNNTLKARPSDPYSYTIPETQISINFAGFGSTLNSDTVLSILAGAEIFVAGMVRRSGPLAPVDRLTRWKLDRVVFEIFPTDRLRWFDLLTALGGMLDFLETFGTFAFVFEINYQGYRSLGVGHMGPQT